MVQFIKLSLGQKIAGIGLDALKGASLTVTPGLILSQALNGWEASEAVSSLINGLGGPLNAEIARWLHGLVSSESEASARVAVQKLELPCSEKQLKAGMNALRQALRDNPTLNVDEVAKKLGVDEAEARILLDASADKSFSIVVASGKIIGYGVVGVSMYFLPQAISLTSALKGMPVLAAVLQSITGYALQNTVQTLFVAGAKDCDCVMRRGAASVNEGTSTPNESERASLLALPASPGRSRV